ncbi:MAG: hypothetical protein AAFX99_36985, partial [Myxococcota bacterium]
MAMVWGVVSGVALEQAEACSWASCNSPGYLLPEEEARIPANAPGLLWTPLALENTAAASDLHLRNLDSEEVLPVEVMPFTAVAQGGPAHLSVLPAAQEGAGWLEEGARYRLVTPNTSAESDCDGPMSPVASTFTVEAEAPLPESLGTACWHAVGSGPLSVAEETACSHQPDARWIDIGLELDPTAQPWTDLWVYEVLVDGEPWAAADFSGALPYPTGSSWIGRGLDRVFAICDAHPHSDASFLVPGTYEVSWRAALPGT